MFCIVPVAKSSFRVPGSLFQHFLRTICNHLAGQRTPQKREKSNPGLVWLALLYNSLFKPSFYEVKEGIDSSPLAKYSLLSEIGLFYDSFQPYFNVPTKNQFLAGMAKCIF